MRNLAAIISRRDDRYVALGWCILGRSLIEYENVAKNVLTNGNLTVTWIVHVHFGSQFPNSC